MVLILFKLLLLIPVTLFFSTGALVVIPFDRRGNVFRWFPRTWCRIILRLFGLRVMTRGTEHLQAGQSYIYVSNHASAMDIPAVLVGIPDEVNIVFKSGLSWVPVWGWALRWGPFIRIDRANARDAMKSLDRVAETIHDGSSVLLFAEGTRTRDGRLQPFKRGAFAIAVRAGRQIVPVTINHTFRILPKGSLRIRPTVIELVISRPIPAGPLAGRDAEQQLMNEVYAAISGKYVDQLQES